MADKKYLNDIGMALSDLRKKFGEDIFSGGRKKELASAIKSDLQKEEDLKYLLLFLAANDVFLFLYENKKLLAYKNVVNACAEFSISNTETSKVLHELKLIDEKGRRFDYKSQKQKRLAAGCFSLVFLLGIARVILSNPNFHKNDGEQYIKGGSFYLSEHNYKVSGFYMGEAEVTFSEYYSLSSSSQGSNFLYFYPVTNVTWYDAIEYCNKLSEEYGLQKVYEINSDGYVSYDISKSGYRLPTKAEWYYAATCANTKSFSTKFSGYDSQNSSSSIYDYVWYLENSNEVTLPVKRKLPNKNGLYDMSGNVSEWCNDYYWDWLKNNDFKKKNPTGPENGTYKSVCGGFYGNSAEKIKILQSQDYAKPESKEVYIGFRVCRTCKRRIF